MVTVPSATESRPELNEQLSGAEFRRWYWLKSELTEFVRQAGLSASGTKPELADRIEAFLDGAPVPSPLPKPSKPSAGPLPEPLTAQTVIPEGQKASQQLRGFFESEIGKSFRYDIFMRTFLANNPGKTLGDAVEHWHATRDAPKPETLESLELVRFTKAWHLAHPHGTVKQCRAAWKVHRSLPVDQRPGPAKMRPEDYQ